MKITIPIEIEIIEEPAQLLDFPFTRITCTNIDAEEVATTENMKAVAIARLGSQLSHSFDTTRWTYEITKRMKEENGD